MNRNNSKQWILTVFVGGGGSGPAVTTSESFKTIRSMWVRIVLGVGGWVGGRGGLHHTRIIKNICKRNVDSLSVQAGGEGGGNGWFSRGVMPAGAPPSTTYSSQQITNLWMFANVEGGMVLLALQNLRKDLQMI